MTKRELRAFVQRLLTLAATPEQIRINRRSSSEIEQRFFNSPYCRERTYRYDSKRGAGLALASFLGNLLLNVQAELTQLSEDYQKFVDEYRGAPSDYHRRERILKYLATLGRSRRQLHLDRKAFARHFDYDAAVERFHVSYNRRERFLVVALGRLGAVAPTTLNAANLSGVEIVNQWKRLRFPEILRDFILWDGDVRVRVDALRCLKNIIEHTEFPKTFRPVPENIQQFLHRCVLDPNQNTWLQCEALGLLALTSPAKIGPIAVQRLQEARAGDDMFPRRFICEQLSAVLPSATARQILELAVIDKSPYVRQGAAMAMLEQPQLWHQSLLAQLAIDDAEPAVRGTVLSRIHRICDWEKMSEFAITLLVKALRKDSNRFVLRCALHGLPKVHAVFLGCQFLDQARVLRQAAISVLTRLNVESSHLSIRRTAAATREEIVGQATPAAQSLFAELGARFKTSRPFQYRPVPDVEDELLGRTLARLAQHDFGFDVKTGRDAKACRWQPFKFRLWRALHEFRIPASDKRQARSHTVGRVFYGKLSAPAARMAELSKTKVPGEPLFIPDEGDWRPFLPLLDQIISAVDHGWPTQPIKIFTCEGVTHIEPPHSLWGRLRARLILSRNFETYADLRNWQEGAPYGPDTYLKKIGELGFKTHFQPYYAPSGKAYPVNPAVTRFFNRALPLPLVEFGQDFRDYFVSVYQNSLRDLALFLVAITGLFVGRHLWMGVLMRKARNRIPLVLGGWGTRGKSGTERIKAAVMNAMGYHVVSKTTGCEAMFLDGYHHGQLREMFLFRPYDKATIWEQVNVVRIAAQLGADVFLWECMGLTPAYVRILQRFWMRDDISTICNTYPDHEDLQGPAGYDIPLVMVNFIPPRGRLITSEEEMVPILEEGARRAQTEFKTINWLQAGLLTPDILARFPYQEHPYNIALVLEMCRSMGIADGFALKAMADNVVADLGVLKVYPITTVRERRFEFVNGHSANERMGCMGNWLRLGFDKHNYLEKPGEWISTVVNNRADRIPRSKVFAAIMVNDICVDRHLLIGTNLEGMRSYLEEEWEKTMAAIPFDDNGASFTNWCRRLRIPMSRAEVNARLRAMLEGIGQAAHLAVTDNAELTAEEISTKLTSLNVSAPIAEDVANFHQQYLDEFNACQPLHQQLLAGTQGELVNRAKAQLWQWFDSHLIIVHDAHATGEQILHRLISASPPGYLNKCMGMQNIKGPGLDFIYRWQYWNEVYAAGQLLLSNDTNIVTQGLRQLATLNEFGQLSENFLYQVFAELKARPVAQDEFIQSSLVTLQDALAAKMASIHDSINQSQASDHGGGNSWRKKILAATEQLIDALDAVRRRKQADAIYVDLCAGHISRSRAINLLQALTKRQKGGWLGAAKK